MATTANYGWTTPDDTDLVKDGASAIRTLGSAIDTTVKANADATGLVHIDTLTIGSGVSSFSVDDVFSSTYTNYKILVTITNVATGNVGLQFKFRASSSDFSTAYYVAGTKATFGAVNSAFATNNAASAQLGVIRPTGTGYDLIMDIFKPFDNTNPTFHFSQFDTNAAESYYGAGVRAANTIADGFTIFPASSTFSGGKVQVFGYKD